MGKYKELSKHLIVMQTKKSCARALMTVCQGVIWLTLSSTTGLAGKLDDFETDVTKNPKHSLSTADWDSTDSDDHPFADILAEICVYSFAYGGLASWQRVQSANSDSTDTDVRLRELGEPLIPFARLDATYQNVQSDVEAYDYSVDAGYGPFGFRFNQSHFRERGPHDSLDIYHVYGLYRMSFGSKVELDMGLGSLTIDGDDHNDQFSFTLPLLIWPNPHIGIEFRPEWSSNVQEYDLGLLVGVPCFSLKAGYRWLRGADESLDGLYAGASMHF